MTQGFGISEEDVYSVLTDKGVSEASWEMADALFGELNAGLVERAAMRASGDLDEQTVAAHEEIWRQAQQSVTLAPYFAAQRAGELDVQLPPARPAKGLGPRF
jgi:hypothetical protein